MNSFYRNPGNNLEKYSLRGKENPDVLIFTEGSSESYFMEKWLSLTHKDPNQIAVLCFNGDKRKLHVFFKKLMMEENFSSVDRFGFFLDAETKPASSTINSIQELLQGLELIPKNIKLKSGYQTIKKYQIAIYVSPNNADPGMIEHMVVNEIMDSDLHSCIQNFKIAVETQLECSLNPKSIVQSYMGIRSPGTCGTGHGFNKLVLNVDHEAYSELRNVMTHIL
jgi:hypothetical protein